MFPVNLSQPLIIIGKGSVGKAYARICASRGLAHFLLCKDDLDICDYNHIERMIIQYEPWAIINTSGYKRVDQAEEDLQSCYHENTKGPQQLARACRRYGIQFMTLSTDLVFDGEKKSPYVESDKVNPLNVYGSSKARAEEFVAKFHPSSLIIRVSACFGPWDNYNYVCSVMKKLEHSQKFEAASDIRISPTYLPHMANASLDLLIGDEFGIWHVANSDDVTWYDLARETAIRTGKDPDLIIPAKGMTSPARMPVYSVLQSEKGLLLPSLQNALNDFFEERLVDA